MGPAALRQKALGRFGGVHRAHVLDGRVPHALLRGVLGPNRPGTMVVEPGSDVPYAGASSA